MVPEGGFLTLTEANPSSLQDESVNSDRCGWLRELRDPHHIRSLSTVTTSSSWPPDTALGPVEERPSRQQDRWAMGGRGPVKHLRDRVKRKKSGEEVEGC